MPRIRIRCHPSNPADTAGRPKLLTCTAVSEAAPADAAKNTERPQPAGAEEVLLFTIPQAGRALNVSRSQVYRLLSAGLLPLKHIGTAARIPASAVRDFVAALPIAQPAPAAA